MRALDREGTTTGVAAQAAGRRLHPSWLVAFVLAVVLQLVVVYVPRAPSTVEGVPHLDKLVHLGIFALPVVAGLLARLPALPVVVGLAVHAALSEQLQTWLLPERSGSWTDGVADLLGVLLGVVVAWGLGWRWGGREVPRVGERAGRDVR